MIEALIDLAKEKMKSNKAMVVHGTTSVDNQIQEHGKGNADVNLFEEVVEQTGWKKEEIFWLWTVEVLWTNDAIKRHLWKLRNSLNKKVVFFFFISVSSDLWHDSWLKQILKIFLQVISIDGKILLNHWPYNHHYILSDCKQNKQIIYIYIVDESVFND